MQINKDGHLVELREKNFTEKRHQEPASTGMYYLKNGLF